MCVYLFLLCCCFSLSIYTIFSCLFTIETSHFCVLSPFFSFRLFRSYSVLYLYSFVVTLEVSPWKTAELCHKSLTPATKPHEDFLPQPLHSCPAVFWFSPFKYFYFCKFTMGLRCWYYLLQTILMFAHLLTFCISDLLSQDPFPFLRVQLWKVPLEQVCCW